MTRRWRCEGAEHVHQGRLRPARWLGRAASVTALTLAMIGGISATGAAPPAAAAAAAAVTCGMTVTQSITLTRDLICPKGVALEVGSPGGHTGPVTIDLGGHLVAGEGTGFFSGAAIFDGGAQLTLQHGRVGTAAIPGNVEILLGRYDVFDDVTFSGLYGGVSASSNNFFTVRNSTFQLGASITTSENYIQVDDNTFVAGPSSATAVYAPLTYTEASGNHFTGYGTAIDVESDVSTVDIHDNTVDGAGTGLIIDGGGGDTLGTVYDNTVTNSTVTGISIGPGSGSEAGVATPGLTVNHNTVSGSLGDGIVVDPTCVQGGCGVMSVSLTGNAATGNGRLGINSPGTVPGVATVVDGGGNLAWGNIDARQCLAVACAAQPAPVTITASAGLPGQFTPVTLTATSSYDVGPTSYALDIVDLTNLSAPQVVASCGRGTTCTAVVTDPPTPRPFGPYSGQPHAFVALIGSPAATTVQAVSQPAVVDWAAATVTLAVSSTAPAATAAVRLVATANEDVGPTPYALDIIDVTDPAHPVVKASCGSGRICATTVGPYAAATRSYEAVIGKPTGRGLTPPYTLSVTWGSSS